MMLKKIGYAGGLSALYTTFIYLGLISFPIRAQPEGQPQNIPGSGHTETICDSSDSSLGADASLQANGCAGEEELPPIEKMPEVVKFVDAVYPPVAMKKGIEGTVSLEIIISDSGLVDSITVLKGIEPSLDEAAVKAVRQFKFSPAVAGGFPVPVAIEYRYTFSLQSIVKKIRQYVNFKGRLVEKGTRSPVPAAMVAVTPLDTAMDTEINIPFSLYLKQIGNFEGQYIEEGTIVTTTDENGYFAFKSLPACSIRVAFPVTGYRPFHSVEVLEKEKELEMLYRLKRETYDEYEIVVYGKAEKKEVAKRSLTISEIKRVPGFSGDAISVVRALPGVARTSFISDDIIVRGSGEEDSRIFLDGVPLPRVFHFGGLRSVYPSDLISAMEMYPGGFNTRFGGAIGGIVDLKGRPAKSDRWHGNIDINMVDAGIMLEGPLKENVGLQAGGRYSYAGKIVEEMTKDQSMQIVPFYWDATVRLDWRLSKKDRLFLTYHSAKDKLEMIGKGMRGGSAEISEDADKGLADIWYQMIIFGYDKRFNKHWSNELRLSGLQDFENGSMFAYSKWDIETFGGYLRDELTGKFSDFITMRAGVDMELNRADYSLNIQGNFGLRKNADIQYFSTLGAYSNVEFDIWKKWMITPGIRYDYYADIEEGQPSFRLTSRLEYADGKTLKGAAGTYSQLPKPWGQSTDEAWGNPDLPSSKAVHSTIGHEWQLTDLIQFDVEAYFNIQDDIPNYTDSIRPENGEHYNFLPDMDARMYGVELMLRHNQGKRFFGWISYALSRSERRAPNPFEEGAANADDWDPDAWTLSDYDQTHNFQILGSWRLPRQWETGFRFRYVSGNPMTPLLPYSQNHFFYDADYGGYEDSMGDAFSERMGPFLQLDVRVDKKFVFNNWMFGAYLDFQNLSYFLYNSPEFYQYNYDMSDRKPIGGYFMPSMGITAQF